MPKQARVILSVLGCGGALILLALLRSGTGGPASETPSRVAVSPVVTHQLAENRWVVSKQDRLAYLADPAKATRQITLQPVPGESKDSVQHLAVISIEADSPMFAAGLRKDDLILMVNDAPIGTMGRAVNLIHEIKSCETLTLKVRRGDIISDYRFEFQ